MTEQHAIIEAEVRELAPVVVDDHSAPASAVDRLLAVVEDAVTSPHSRRSYRTAVLTFCDWHAAEGRPEISKATVNAYRAHLERRVEANEIRPATANHRLSVVRRMFRELADNGAMPHAAADAIGRVKGVRASGRRLGNWLDAATAQRMLELPDADTLAGKRDRAMLAVLLGAGLRRLEVSRLEFEHIAIRDGRALLADVLGKGNKLRTIPIPAWVHEALTGWCKAAKISAGPIFRRFNRASELTDDRITPAGVRHVVGIYAAELGMPDLAPHDLRRTFAQMLHRAGYPLEQIQLILGHASSRTTELYLGIDLDLDRDPGDFLPIGYGSEAPADG